MAGDVKVKEVKYFQRDLTPQTVREVEAEVAKYLADGWTILYTDHRAVANTSAEIFHVFVR